MEAKSANAQAIAALEWMAQTVHQGYHVDQPGTWLECPKSICQHAIELIRGLVGGKNMNKQTDPPRRFGPKAKDHPGIGLSCNACGVRFKEGDFTTLIPLGPGDRPEAQEAARAGRPYNAVAIEVHYTCATGLP